MNKYIHYLAGTAMLVFAAYQLVRADLWEFSLYLATGIAFLLTGLIRNNVFPGSYRLLNVLSWVFIGLAVFLFLFLVRTDSQPH